MRDLFILKRFYIKKDDIGNFYFNVLREMPFQFSDSVMCMNIGTPKIFIFHFGQMENYFWCPNTYAHYGTYGLVLSELLYSISWITDRVKRFR